MTAHSVLEEELHGLSDGRLTAARRTEVEAWLASHPREAAQVEAWRAQNALLHRAYDPVLVAPLPARLLDATAHADRFSALRVAAAVAWLALGGIVGFLVRGEFPATAPQATLPHQAALAHAVFSPEVRHPVEVDAAQEAHLAAWLSKRLGATLKPPHLDAAGYALLGGRLLTDDGGSGNGAVAQFMYQDARGARLTLYVRNDANGSGTGETAFRFSREGNIGVFYWLDGRFGYALSGSAEKTELLRVATIVYRQLNP
jgi:anti-sigma factor RsiW